MNRRIISIMLLCSTVLLGGCSGGSLYSNYREVEQLSVIETMGFDTSPRGVVLSVSSGAPVGGSTRTCLTAEDKSITLARDKIQEYSASEQLFFAHTAFIVIGGDTAKSGISRYLDYVGRAPDLRLDVPMLVVNGGTAREIITKSGSKSTDATSVFKSLERDLLQQGECPVFSVREIIAALDLNDCALATAVKAVPAAKVSPGAKPDELTAIPDGLAVLKNGHSIGRLDMDAAFGVCAITGNLGPCPVELETKNGKAAVQISDCSCELKPVIENDELTGLRLQIDISAALSELDGSADDKMLSQALAKLTQKRAEKALRASQKLACDFMQLGARLDRMKSGAPDGLTLGLSPLLPGLECSVTVSAEVNRSFDVTGD